MPNKDLQEEIRELLHNFGLSLAVSDHETLEEDLDQATAKLNDLIIRERRRGYDSGYNRASRRLKKTNWCLWCGKTIEFSFDDEYHNQCLVIKNKIREEK